MEKCAKAGYLQRSAAFAQTFADICRDALHKNGE
jgi:hypothetical protein